MNLQDQIREYLVDNLLYVDDASRYDNDTSFIGEGLIDSMGVMELVAYVQSEFRLEVSEEEVIPQNFDSINQIAAFVRRKQAQGSLSEAPNNHARPGRTPEHSIAPAE